MDDLRLLEHLREKGGDMAGESAPEVARRAREKAERLQRRAELFERGAEGEQATADVLAVLPAGWTALHDVRWPKRRLANIDHIVVGPGGVFVIDSKNWSGHVSIEDGRLRQNGRFRDKAVAGCADAGLAIAEIAGTHADKIFRSSASPGSRMWLAGAAT